MTVLSRDVKLPNCERIAYREREGETAPLLFIHANFSAASHWNRLFETLDSHFHLLAPDLRGCGGSSYESQVDAVADYSRDLVALVETLDLGPVHVVAWSGGSTIAMQLELLAPELVRSQTFISPVSTRGYPVLQKDESGAVTEPEPLTSREQLANDALQVAPLKIAMETENVAAVREYFETVVFADTVPEAFDLDAHMADVFTQEGFIDFVYANAHFNISPYDNGVNAGTDEARDLEAPTLVLYGDADQVILEKMIDQTLTDLGTDAALIVLPDVGHAAAIEAPERVAKELTTFLSPLEAGMRID
ncbi:alpha/beta fold hydrolase [Haladaptatus sp. DYSN1]|uniref:alpha/beta fold hydrolase n=1 Tax=unclassified Haladaptatus TaxID=2622732 RepID=UPI002406B5FE|nr:alpha/beta hydrolase [Haladaptatus sp. DYSN1]